MEIKAKDLVEWVVESTLLKFSKCSLEVEEVWEVWEEWVVWVEWVEWEVWVISEVFRWVVAEKEIKNTLLDLVDCFICLYKEFIWWYENYY